MKFKEEAIEYLNKVIFSNKSKISKSDLEMLITIREKIKNEKSKGVLITLLEELVKIFT